MSKLDKGPEASSTAIKPQNQRSLRNRFKNPNNNDTFTSAFSEELTDRDIANKTFSEMLNNKTYSNLQMDNMHSSLEQSSLGILELDNMSDIGNTRRMLPFNIHNNQSFLNRSCRVTQARSSLDRASSITNVFNENEVIDTRFKTSLTNTTNAFRDMFKENINKSNSSYSSYSSEDFMSGSQFKENLVEIEEVNRREFGSLSESRFNFSLEEEKQSIENGSFAAKYFAAKSVPIEDLSSIFPKKQHNNETFTKRFQEKKSSLLDSFNDTKQEKKEEHTPMHYDTMSSITSWTDSHVSNNELTSLSAISEYISKAKSHPEEITRALLSGDLSDNKLLNEPNKFLQRRFSTSTTFSIALQNLEHAEIPFPALESYSYIIPPKKDSKINKNSLKPNESINNIKENDEHLKSEEPINTPTHCSVINKNNVSTVFDKKQKNIHLKNSCHFMLTPKSGYFEDCSTETKSLENNIDLSDFSILTNNHDIFNEVSLNKSTNVSKIVYCNETLCQDKLNKSNVQDYRKMSDVLEIGDICLGTYSQAVITLENCLTIDATYTLTLLDISLDHTKNNIFTENNQKETNVATVVCSHKICKISAFSEATFTVGIIPLISGNISIHIKLDSNDVAQEIYRNIQIHSVEPQITWVNNSFGSIDFGLLPELSQKSLPIKFLNEGTYQVPIKFILIQDQCEQIQVKAIINPSELWQCDVNILTPNFSKNRKTNLITGRLQVILDSVEELSRSYSPLLYCSNLSGRVGLTSISFDQNPLVLKKNEDSTLSGVLEISNISELPICLSVQQNSKQCPGLTIQPDKFQLDINEKVKLQVMFFPSKLFSNFNETSIYLQVVSSQKQFSVKINHTESKIEFQPTSTPSSRPISPWSNSSSSAVGQLELESTCSNLIWGSVPPNTKSIQTFTLRNRGSHKEKLILSIKDNKNCFKLISSGENQVTEMKLLLEPMESQKLSVALISTANEGQAYGQIIFQRQRSSEKRVISLFGYCGCSVVIVQGVFEDNFGNMWLYPNPELMTAQFSVTNSGNTTAFVKIGQENSSEDIIQPNEFILKKGETTTVEITIVMSPERLEMLIENDSNSKVININTISLIYGDEVSRVRLSRLWKKTKNGKKNVYPDQQRLDEISSMFDGVNFANVDHLIDSEKSLFKLWKMGVSEDSIAVLMEKSNLESLLLDTTTVFSDLETTVINRLL